MKPDFCRLRQRIAAWGFRPGLWLGLCLCLFCCSVLPARALELVDSRGVTVRLERPAQRIIALYGAFNEILLALDAREALVARTAADAAIPGLQDLPAVGTHMRPNAELVAARQPDVVLQLAGRQEVLTQTEALEAVGIPVLVYEMQSFEQLFAVTRALGRLTGRETRAEALVADWQRRLAVLAQRYAGQPPVRVFYEVRYPNLLAAGRASIVDEIIRHAGGRNVLDAPQKLVRCNEEMLVALDPEAYILQQGPMNPAPQAPAERPHYRGLSAVRSGRVLLVDEHLFARPGPRSVEAAERLARWLHGEEQGSGE
ncbi:MAG: ABC transporter substrate-binding protein [Desulfovibrio sp.]|uniref:ABC transporter substrate-binding protein n=1 Tax=Desulfovibrio TaxID=872 RepID=UPI0026ECCE5E|nr:MULTISPECIES: ABC transporter substrate-binding protein [Desulfovibrio]MBS5807429.1 ABC transporter substrate-binding protein [Desulfovibrio piger]MEE0069867.1 ABC transporter substrate-binding protein [Desulfovibrio sp.]